MSQRPASVSPPGGAPILRSMLSQRAPRDANARVRAMLGARLGTDAVTLHRSGREALRVALRALATSSTRDEVIVPAYTCYSVPAAVIAAGLKIRPVEVDSSGRIDPVAFSKLPLQKAVAVIVCNLFGHCEPIRDWSALADDAEVAIIDDAAQALGATSEEGAAGARGAVGVLSFGRGKPLAALGGGACAWHNNLDQAPVRLSQNESPRPSALRAGASALLHDIALQPKIFTQLKRLPFLGIGETIFEPDFEGGEITSPSLTLAHAQLPRLDADAAFRRRNAEALSEVFQAAGYTPLTSTESSPSVYPRLAVRAPSEALRERAVEQLAPFGAGRLYPKAISEIAGLQSHRSGTDSFPVATELAAHLFTMRTTRSDSAAEREEIAALLGASRV